MTRKACFGDRSIFGAIRDYESRVYVRATRRGSIEQTMIEREGARKNRERPRRRSHDSFFLPTPFFPLFFK